MKIDVAGRRFEVEPKLREYAEEKVGALEKYLPRAVRGLTLAAVTLEDDVSGREDNRFVAEVVMTVEGDTLVSREGTVNMYAAIDIVEAKLKAQCMKYKSKHVEEPRRNRMVAKLVGERDGIEDPTILE